MLKGDVASDKAFGSHVFCNSLQITTRPRKRMKKAMPLKQMLLRTLLLW